MQHKAEKFVRQIECLSAIVMAISAALWGAYWSGFAWVGDKLVKAFLAKPYFFALSVLVSMALVWGFHRRDFYRKYPLLWSFVPCCFLLFWGSAYLGNFDWERVIPVAFACLIAYILYVAMTAEPKERENVDEPEDDLLGRGHLYQNITDEIMSINPQNLGKRAVAICGDWGSGKSHLVRYIKRRLLQYSPSSDTSPIKGYRVLTVDLWSCRTPESAWKHIAAEVISATTTYKGDIFSRTNWAMLRLLNILNLPLESHVAETVKFFANSSSNEKEACENLTSLINFEECKRPLVLILENLDRCQDEVIVSLLPLMERLKRIDGMIVIGVIAKNRVIAQFDRKIDIAGYMMKLFDLPMFIPRPTEKDAKNMCHEIFKQKQQESPELSAPHLAEIISRDKLLKLDNPRQIQRFCSRLWQLDARYLSRFQDDTSRDMYNAFFSVISREETVLWVAALDLFYPNIHQYLMEQKSSALNFIKGIPNALLFSEEETDIDGETEDKIVLQWKQKYSETETWPFTDRLLSSILQRLKSTDYSYLRYALFKEYASLSEVSLMDCKNFLNMSDDVRKYGLENMIKKYYGNKLNPNSLYKLYGDIFEYVLSCPYSRNAAEFIRGCIDENKNWIKSGRKEIYISYKDDLILFYKIMAYEMNAPKSNLFHSLLKAIPLRLVSEVLKNLLAYKNGFPITFDLENSVWYLFDQIKKTPFSTQIGQLSTRYAYLLCDAICNGSINRSMAEGCKFDIHDNYSKQFQKGVTRFIWKKLNPISDRFEELCEKLIYALTYQTIEKGKKRKAMPCHLPYVKIWCELCDKIHFSEAVFSPSVDMLLQKTKLLIREELERIRKELQESDVKHAGSTSIILKRQEMGTEKVLSLLEHRDI